MSDFCIRLREERKRLGLSQERLAELGGVKLNAQSNYETGKRVPDAAYLEAIAMHDVDVAYVLTGHRMHMQGHKPSAVSPAPDSTKYNPAKPRPVHVASERVPTSGGGETVQREVTPEEAALLDNYKAADEEGRATARSVLDALAQPKKRANG